MLHKSDHADAVVLLLQSAAPSTVEREREKVRPSGGTSAADKQQQVRCSCSAALWESSPDVVNRRLATRDLHTSLLALDGASTASVLL